MRIVSENYKYTAWENNIGVFDEKDLYFIECGGRVKIGRSKDTDKRQKELEIGMPFESTILHIAKNKGHMEWAVHKGLSSYHVKGEWFELSDSVKAFIEYVKGKDDVMPSYYVFESERTKDMPPAQLFLEYAYKMLSNKHKMANFDHCIHSIKISPKTEYGYSVYISAGAYYKMRKMIIDAALCDPELPSFEECNFSMSVFDFSLDQRYGYRLRVFAPTNYKEFSFYDFVHNEDMNKLDRLDPISKYNLIKGLV